MSVNQEKFSALNKARKATFTNVSNAISQLNLHALTAIKQQAYMRTNPDANGADELIAIVTPDFLAAAAAFNAVAEKLQDMQKVQAGEMTVEALISKYSIDLVAFSAELI